MEIFTSLIAGIFALIAAYLGWRLRQSENAASFLSEKRKTKEELYKKIHRTFDGVIQAVIRHEGTVMQKDFIELNAEVKLLASDELGNLYTESCQHLDEWAIIYQKAWPNTNIVQAPDPTVKHKEPARVAYTRLLEKLEALDNYMRQDLKSNT